MFPAASLWQYAPPSATKPQPTSPRRLSQLSSQLSGTTLTSQIPAINPAATMGDVAINDPPSKDGDHLLIVWAFPPPPTALDSIKSKFPNLKITFHLIKWVDKESPNTRTAAPEGIDEYIIPIYHQERIYTFADYGIPSETWLSATHLCKCYSTYIPTYTKT